MGSDWIMLHRKSLESRVFSDERLWRLWCWCLLRSNWKRSWYAGCELQPGQFACGREAASAELGISGSAWYRGMQKLQEIGCVKIEANNRFSVISIINWRKYQAKQGGGEQQTDSVSPTNTLVSGVPPDVSRTTGEQRMDSQRTTDEQQADTEEELLRRKEGKNYSLSNEVRELSNHWRESEEFRETWINWLGHLAGIKGPQFANPNREQVMLYELGRFKTEEATEVVRFSTLKGAGSLITNGDHKQPERTEKANGRAVRGKAVALRD